MSLTPKQQCFVDEYLVDLNATQAALRAGYSKKTAKSIGQENLTKPAIKAAVEKAMAERSGRTEITADRVLEEFGRIGFSNLADLVDLKSPNLQIDLSNITRDQAAAISELTVDRRYDSGDSDGFTDRIRLKLHNKLGALESLARHLGMFNDKLELTAKIEDVTSIIARRKEAARARRASKD